MCQIRVRNFYAIQRYLGDVLKNVVVEQPMEPTRAARLGYLVSAEIFDVSHRF